MCDCVHLRQPLRWRAAAGARRRSWAGVHEHQNKEDKVACLVTLKSEAHQADPQPEPPESFLRPRRVQRLVQMRGQSGDKPQEEAGPAT
jgi:hypothetical protein